MLYLNTNSLDCALRIAYMQIQSAKIRLIKEAASFDILKNCKIIVRKVISAGKKNL